MFKDREDSLFPIFHEKGYFLQTFTPQNMSPPPSNLGLLAPAHLPA